MTGPGYVYDGDFDFVRTRELQGKAFFLADLGGARFRDCELVDVRFDDCIVHDVNLNGDVQRLVVNDVDVTTYVEGELDRRHPERVPIRALRTAADPHLADIRPIAQTLERRWTDLLARADRLPEPARQERVNGEWSMTETLRHLTFCIDAWISRTVLDEDRPYHPLGFPAGGYPRDDAAAIGLDLDATPTYAEATDAWQSRAAVLRRVLADLTDADLLRECLRNPAPGYPEEPVPVFRCLRVALNEHCEHGRYADRDLAVLEARSG